MRLDEVAMGARTKVIRTVNAILGINPGVDSPITITLAPESQVGTTQLFFGVDMHFDMSSALDDMSDDPGIKARLEKSAAKRKAKMEVDGRKALLNLAHELAQVKRIGFEGMSHKKGWQNVKIIPPSDLTLDNIYSKPESTFFVFDVPEGKNDL